MIEKRTRPRHSVPLPVRGQVRAAVANAGSTTRVPAPARAGRPVVVVVRRRSACTVMCTVGPVADDDRLGRAGRIAAGQPDWPR